MHRTLIVAKIQPDAERRVAEIFGESDQTELPRVAGVQHRSLYRLGDLYVHLLETEVTGDSAVGDARKHPEFARVSGLLEEHITPYLPTWKSPKDAMAECFYSWESKDSARRA
ncbi:TcmI family type II polyketide cyclase [Amycolatopsis nigrescens]|uniref:TcmI family type II polyketide cyclase n=1 Tax=Amycolatopsis nigrescens TaxID=381445 RepID=UPI000363A198|nr:TcmI family type II polyketide cyclase [Amycolatopsis nigrescens]